jgi:hypothetical protein
MKTRHLTQAQKQTLADIVGDDLGGAFEVMITVANMAEGRINGFDEACKVADVVCKAARVVKESKVRS